MKKETSDNSHIFDWDRCGDLETLIMREMLYADPREVLRKYSKTQLKKIFLENIHLFRRKNRAFWKLVLEVSDDEIAEAAEKSFREPLSIWPH